MCLSDFFCMKEDVDAQTSAFNKFLFCLSPKISLAFIMALEPFVRSYSDQFGCRVI